MEASVGEEVYSGCGIWLEASKMDEGGGDVLPGLGTGENPGSWVLYILEPVKRLVGYPRQDPTAVVQTGGDESVNEGLCHGVREHWPESGRIIQVQESRLSDGFDVWLEREGGVQNDTQVVDSWGRVGDASVHIITLGVTIMSSVLLLLSLSRYFWLGRTVPLLTYRSVP